MCARQGRRTPGRSRPCTPSRADALQRLGGEPAHVRALRAELGTSQGTVGRVAQQLGYGVESVRLWVKQAEIDSGEAVGTTTADAARITELEQDNRELRRANAILRSASALFATACEGSVMPSTDAAASEVGAPMEIWYETVARSLRDCWNPPGSGAGPVRTRDR